MADQYPGRRPRSWPSIRGEPEERASRALTRLEDISRLIAEWVWEVDGDGVITYVSNRVTESLGLLPVQLVGRPFMEIGTLRLDDAQLAAFHWESPFRELACDIRGADGIVHHHLVSGIPFYDHRTWRFEGACGTARDVTEMKTSKDALERANRLLREANSAKSAFLASMSHELRTPLNAVMGFSQVLGDEMIGSIGNQRYRDYARGIFESGEHLLSLVNDVLDLAEIEAGELKLQEMTIDIEQMIVECIDVVRVNAAAGDLTVKSEIESDLPLLLADLRAVRQMVLNLLSNSLKFTPGGGTVRVLAERTENLGVLVAVEDTGIGIPANEIPLVTSPFGHTDSIDTSDSQRGIGLGLAIAKSLAEKHQGHLEISSTVGKGTVVKLLFPPERLSEQTAGPF